MAVLPVVKYNDPILRRRTKLVTDFSQISSVVGDMFDTMYQEEGIGLAANQVGVELNLMVIDVSHAEEWDTPFIFVNGEILEKWGESVMEEGCLSLPGIRVDVRRSDGVRFAYQNLSGSRYTEEFEGLLARVIQHETDHLSGMVIIDRVSPLTRQRYSQQIKQIASSSLRKRSENRSSAPGG